MLESLPLPPSCTVASGGGLQAWWAFQEPWDLREDGVREQAKRVARGWHETIADAADRAGGRRVDSVHDLARILRLPGTMNWKRGEPVPVRIVDGPHQDRRVNPDDIVRVSLGEDQWRRGVASSANVVGNLVLSSDAQPPIEKFEALKGNDEKFRRTWEHRRPDLRDESLSGYDMALAAITVRVGWEDQEITNLLIAHRRKWGGDLKLRERYYAGTIENARQGMEVSNLTSEIRSSQSAGPANDPQAAEENRDRMLRLFSAVTGAPLSTVTVYLPDRTNLTLSFSDGRKFHVDQDTLCDWLKFWKRLRASGFAPRTERPKQADWLAVVSGLYDVAQEVRVEGSGTAARVAALVVTLARECSVPIDASEDSRTELRAAAIRNNGAFAWEGRLWVRIEGLVRAAEDRRIRGQLTEATYLRGVLVEDLKAERRVFSVLVKDDSKPGRRGLKAVGGRQDEEGPRPAPGPRNQLGGTLYGVSPAVLREAVDESAEILAEAQHESDEARGQRSDGPATL